MSCRSLSLAASRSLPAVNVSTFLRFSAFLFFSLLQTYLVFLQITHTGGRTLSRPFSGAPTDVCDLVNLRSFSGGSSSSLSACKIYYRSSMITVQGTTYNYTARNATDWLQVVDFTGLLQVVNKLQQACQFHQVAASL